MQKNISFSFSFYWTKTVSMLFDDNFILETYFIYCLQVGIELYWMLHEYWKHKKYFIKINSTKSNYTYTWYKNVYALFLWKIIYNTCILQTFYDKMYAYLKQNDFNLFKPLFVHITTIVCPVTKLWISELYWWVMIYNYKHMFQLALFYKNLIFVFDTVIKINKVGT